MALTQISTKGIKDGTITGTDLATNVDLVDNQKLRLGAGNDLQIYHNGTASKIDNTTGNLTVKTDNTLGLYTYANTEAMAKFIANGAVELYHDNVLKLTTLSAGVQMANGSGNNTLSIYDNDKLSFGNAGDLKIYHDGTASYIDNSTGSFFLRSDTIKLRGKSADEDLIEAFVNGSVRLYYDNSQKLETSSGGVQVTGNLGFTSNNSLIHTGSSGNTLSIQGGATNMGGLIELRGGNSSGDIRMFAQGTTSTKVERLRIDSSGHVMIGTTTEGEDTGNDLTIANSGDCGITIRSGTSSKAKLLFSDGTSGDAEFRGNIQYDHNGDYMKFSTAASEHMRIDSSGNTGIGTTSPNVSGFNTDAQVLTLSGPKRGFIELRGNTQAADSIGGIRFFSANNVEAEISSVTDSSYNGDLRFTTNGNQRMSIDQSGRVTRPYQVAWAMHGSSGQQNLNAGDKVLFNANGSGFGNFSNRNHGGVDTTNCSYTVPVTGLYCIIVTIFFYTNNASNICSIVPRVNNNPVDNGNDSVFLFGSAASSGTNNVTSSGSVLLQLNANDEITIHRRTGEPGTNMIYTPHSHFCGYLIG